MDVALATALLGLIGVLVSLSGAVLFAVRADRRLEPRHQRDPIEKRRGRVKRLTQSLEESTDLLGELQADINAGMTRADELRQQIEQHTALAKLTSEQAEAFESLVAEEIGKSSRTGFRQQFWLSLVFFGLGVGSTIALEAWVFD
jgi:phage terminase Nu1 subunit (DNA packaging protein)